MKVFNCDRCGHEILVDKSSELEEIKCSHCNKEFIVDSKTKRLALIIVIALIMVISLIISLISTAFNISLIIMLIPTLLIGFFAYRFALLILAKLNKINYEGK